MNERAKVRVLLVDDHRLVREGLRRTLEDAGVEVVGEAADGAEGLDLAERLRPDVALMDVSMPVLDGVAATRRMRARSPDTNVVILTMHAETELLERSRAAGAVGYLLKDASGEEVVQAVARAAGGHRVVSAGLLTGASGAADVASPEGDAAAEVELTPRELEILQLLAEGAAPADVAERLVISPKTVRNHLTHVYEKLDVGSRSQAIVAALKLGLIDLQ